MVLTIAAIWVTARGVKLSTAAVGVAAGGAGRGDAGGLRGRRWSISARHLSGVPFSWAHLSGGLTGLSRGFPLALYMFIGWENGPALAEECRDPKRTVPRALYISIAIATALFVFFAYATVTGFHYDVSSIGRTSVPFLTVADHDLGGRGGPGLDRRDRLGARRRWWPAPARRRECCSTGDGPGCCRRRSARLRAQTNTPVNALIAMGAVGLGIIGIWWLTHVIGADRRIAEPGRPLCRVLHDGHDRDPRRLLTDEALAAGVHVAPAPRDVLPAAPRRRSRVLGALPS